MPPVHAEWYCKHCDKNPRSPGVVGPPVRPRGPNCSEDELYFEKVKKCVWAYQDMKESGDDNEGSFRYTTSFGTTTWVSGWIDGEWKHCTSYARGFAQAFGTNNAGYVLKFRLQGTGGAGQGTGITLDFRYKQNQYYFRVEYDRDNKQFEFIDSNNQNPLGTEPGTAIILDLIITEEGMYVEVNGHKYGTNNVSIKGASSGYWYCFQINESWTYADMYDDYEYEKQG